MPAAAHRLLLIAVVALPWLWPFTSGPTAGTQPYLVSLALGAVLLVLWPARPDTRQAARWVAAGWLLAAVLSAVIGLIQYFNLEGPLYPWIDLAQPGLAFGNLRQPNQLATLLAIGLVALRTQVPVGRWPAAALAGLAALLVVALAATASRIGLVELLALALLTVLWAREGGRWRGELAVALSLLALYALAALTLPWLAEATTGVAGRDVFERLRTGDSLCGSRVTLWSNVLHLIAQKPWAGWGWGELAYAHYSTLYDGPRFCNILDNAHNLPLHLAVELGVPVALAVCALLAWLVWRGAPWREREPVRQLAWAVLAAIGLHSLVEYPLWYGPFQIAALISIWLLWATRAGAAAAGHSQLVALRRGAGVLLLLATAYAGWDYWRVSQLYLPLEQRATRWRDEPMAAARQTLLFGGAVRFAEVTTRPVTRENAAWMLDAASRLLHYSPEPRVIERVIEAATLLGRDDVALAQLARFKAAFPAEERQWAADNVRMLEGARVLQRGASAP